MPQQSEVLRRALEAMAAICGPASMEQIEPRPPQPMLHAPEAWMEDFHWWALTQCVFRDRCFGHVRALLRDFCEWQLIRDEVPCTRSTFEVLLRDAGFLFADGLVYGLLLKADVLAMEPDDTGTVPLASTVTGTIREKILPRAVSPTQEWISRPTGSVR